MGSSREKKADTLILKLKGVVRSMSLSLRGESLPYQSSSEWADFEIHKWKSKKLSVAWTLPHVISNWLAIAHDYRQVAPLATRTSMFFKGHFNTFSLSGAHVAVASGAPNVIASQLQMT